MWEVGGRGGKLEGRCGKLEGRCGMLGVGVGSWG